MPFKDINKKDRKMLIRMFLDTYGSELGMAHDQLIVALIGMFRSAFKDTDIVQKRQYARTYYRGMVQWAKEQFADMRRKPARDMKKRLSSKPARPYNQYRINIYMRGLGEGFIDWLDELNEKYDLSRGETLKALIYLAYKEYRDNHKTILQASSEIPGHRRARNV